MSKLDQIKALREARYKPLLPRGTIMTFAPVTPVTTSAPVVTTVTGCCPTCGQRLPAQTKAAAKQRAYRQRKVKT